MERERSNIDLILNYCDEFDLPLNSQKAYVLATVQHETNNTYEPVKEAYWLSEKWRKNNLRYYPYYGRGFVQLTWKENYEKYSEILNKDLIKYPDLVMEPDTSAFILVHGFKYGKFTGKKMEDYINEYESDYYNARRCINGLDRARYITNLAVKWKRELDDQV